MKDNEVFLIFQPRRLETGEEFERALARSDSAGLENESKWGGRRRSIHRQPLTGFKAGSCAQMWLNESECRSMRSKRGSPPHPNPLPQGGEGAMARVEMMENAGLDSTLLELKDLRMNGFNSRAEPNPQGRRMFEMGCFSGRAVDSAADRLQCSCKAW